MSAQSDIRAAALRLLAAREHSTSELRRKLGQKGFESAPVEAVLADLTHEKLLSDERFVEAFISSRRRRGQGPVRILRDLQEHGLDADLITAWLDPADPDWLDEARAVREKKFGRAPADDFQEQMRQARFLEYRGFSHEQIRRVLKDDEVITS